MLKLLHYYQYKTLQKLPVLTAVFAFLLFTNHSNAQADSLQPLKVPKKLSQVTIVYDMQISTKKKKPGIAETYNGGIKTLFIQNGKTRIRMVSLMRVESIFFLPANTADKKIVLLKEYGKEKYKSFIDSAGWQKWNARYLQASVVAQNDSLEILGFLCRKVSINLSEDNSVEAYYTDSVRVENQFTEPLFASIPGLVLQYTYKSKKGSITYKASQLSEAPIDAGLFKIPTTGYKIKKFCPDCPVKETNLDEEPEDEEEPKQ
jgi:hypothetical protein